MAIMREYQNKIIERIEPTIENRSPMALYEGKKQPEAKIVKSQFIREMPERVTFERLIYFHDSIPQIRIAVASYVELITGTEMTISCKSDEATDLLNEWVRRNNFYNKFENLVTTWLICGNAILEKLSESDITDVSEVDMSTILAKKRNDIGELEYYEQRQEQGKVVRLGEGSLDRFIEFNLGQYSKQAWGRSLFYPLAVPRTIGQRHTPPICEIIIGAEDASAAMLLNDAYPIKTITYEGANDEYLEKETRKWQTYKPGDTRIQKVKPQIEFFQSQNSGQKYDPIWQHFENLMQHGTLFPSDIMTGDFTSRASSETTESIVMKIARGFTQYLCFKLKTELFEPILEQNGHNAEEEELDVSFTTQNIIELDVSQVKDLVNTGLMTINEGREWLRNNAGMELTDDQEIMAKQEQEQQDHDAEMQSKINDLESKVKQFSLNADTDSKLREIQDKMEAKLEKVYEARQAENSSLEKRRINALEKMVKEALN